MPANVGLFRRIMDKQPKHTWELVEWFFRERARETITSELYTFGKDNKSLGYRMRKANSEGGAFMYAALGLVIAVAVHDSKITS